MVYVCLQFKNACDIISPPSWEKLEFSRKVGSNLDFLHRDGAVVSFNISAISNALSKAFLRNREKELRRQKESYTLVLNSTADALLYYLFEEEYYREEIEQRIELDRIEKELQAIKQIKRYKDNAESARIRDLLLAQQRGASRSTAMRYATDLSLVTMPTPPTEETALGSLNCGRTYHVAV